MLKRLYYEMTYRIAVLTGRPWRSPSGHTVLSPGRLLDLQENGAQRVGETTIDWARRLHGNAYIEQWKRDHPELIAQYNVPKTAVEIK